MTLSELLNSDLKTIAQELLRGWRWWIAELAEMTPAPLRRLGDTGPLIKADSLGNLIDAPKGVDTATVVIDPAAALVRTVQIPAMSNADFETLIAFEGDKLLPVPASEMLIATSAGSGAMALAALPQEIAGRIAGAAEARAIRLRTVKLGTPNGGADPRFDLLPAMRKSGLVGAGGRARGVWLLAAILAATNVAVAMARDQAEVDRLRAQVASQEPGAMVAQRIIAQVRRTGRVAHQAATERRRLNPLEDLAAIGAAMPPAAWVQRYEWNGQTIRMTGYRPRSVDVAAALRKSPIVASVRAAQSEALGEAAAGAPFELEIVLRRR